MGKRFDTYAFDPPHTRTFCKMFITCIFGFKTVPLGLANYVGWKGKRVLVRETIAKLSKVFSILVHFNAREWALCGVVTLKFLFVAQQYHFNAFPRIYDLTKYDRTGVSKRFTVERAVSGILGTVDRADI